MMKKSIKKSCALLIACALTLSAFAVLPKANAANMVDTGKKDCSIDFKTGSVVVPFTSDTMERF